MYLFGMHHILFRVEKKLTSCPFLGICSSSEEINRRRSSSSPIDNWWEFYQIVVDSHKDGLPTNRTYQSDDEIALTSDCENKCVFILALETDTLSQHSIETVTMEDSSKIIGFCFTQSCQLYPILTLTSFAQLKSLRVNKNSVASLQC